MNNSNNKGMFIETIINNSINYYERNNIAVFRKLEIPIKIIKINENSVVGKLKSKSDVDYYGIYKSRFICLESKQINTLSFNTSLLKKHQKKFLNLIKDHGGTSILIIYFNKTNKYIKVQWSHYWNIIFTLKKTINYEFIIKKAKFLELHFPGWIDFLN